MTALGWSMKPGSSSVARPPSRCRRWVITRGHEIMLETPRVDVTDPRMRLAGSRSVLVEFPRLFIPAGSIAALSTLRADGWLPIVAHPERYLNTNVEWGDLDLIEQWRRVGARMAVNAGSLLGGFGTGAAETVREMLSQGWVDVISSDYHARHSRPLVLRAAYERMVAHGGEVQAQLAVLDQPRAGNGRRRNDSRAAAAGVREFLASLPQHLFLTFSSLFP